MNPSNAATPAASIGIMGGGQLGRMLSEAAIRQGAAPVALVASESDPAAGVPGVSLVEGALDDEAAVSELFERSTCVTVENEFLDEQVIRAAQARHPGVLFCPGLGCIAPAQDKLAQKAVFSELGVDFAAYEVVSGETAGVLAPRLLERFPAGYVLKWARFGYDGRGNFTVADPSRAPLDEMERFLDSARQRGSAVYAEERVEFAAELAMVSVRGRNRGQVFLPLVESWHERSVLRETAGPATAMGYDPAYEVRSQDVMRGIGERLDICGAFAVEYFLTRDGRLLANEMAPRVHNTGHYTLWDGQLSQFDLSVLAVLGRPLPDPQVRGVAVMRNLLGPFDGEAGPSRPPPREEVPSDAELYWYGKSETKPGRKMGHITGRADDAREAAELLARIRDYERRHWAQPVLKEG